MLINCQTFRWFVGSCLCVCIYFPKFFPTFLESGIPDNIKMTVYGDVLHVQWEAPLEPNGITTGYILQLDPKRDFQSRKKLDHIVVDKIDREYYIRGMTPCKFYQVKIAVMNQNGEGRYYQRRMAVSMPDSMCYSFTSIISHFVCLCLYIYIYIYIYIF